MLPIVLRLSKNNKGKTRKQANVIPNAELQGLAQQKVGGCFSYVGGSSYASWYYKNHIGCNKDDIGVVVR